MASRAPCAGWTALDKKNTLGGTLQLGSAKVFPEGVDGGVPFLEF
jgi:hypothetical protein